MSYGMRANGIIGAWPIISECEVAQFLGCSCNPPNIFLSFIPQDNKKIEVTVDKYNETKSNIRKRTKRSSE